MEQNDKLEKKGHEGRDDLAGEHKIGDAGQVVFFIIFLAVWIMDSFIFKFTTQYCVYLSLYIRIPIGILLLLTSLYFAKSGLKIVFNEIRSRPSVIKKGVFAIVRHPIYFGTILFYLGLLVFTFSIASAAVLIVIILFYQFISNYEEKLLHEKFGDQYKEYCQKVPMWIPGLKKK